MIIEGRREDESDILNKMDNENIKYDLMRYKELQQNRELTKNKLLDL